MFHYLNKLITSSLSFKTTKIITLCVACMMVMFACRKDKEFASSNSLLGGATTEKVQSITVAKGFFNAYMDFIPKYFKFKSIQPFYEGAVADGSVVEIPFAVDGKVAGLSQYETFEHLGKQRLVVINKPKVGLGKECYIVNYVPSKIFKGKIADVTTNNLQAQRFDGAIIVQDLDGKDVAAYYMEEGKVTKTLTHSPNDPTKRGKLTCDVSITYWYCYGRMGDYIGTATPCGETATVDCYFSGNFGGGGNGWSDGGSDNWTGGGGGDNNNNSGQPADPSFGWGRWVEGMPVPTTVVQMCPHSIQQGFMEAGRNFAPFIAGSNLGNLSGQSVLSAEGHYMDINIPVLDRNGDQILISSFGLNINVLNTSPNDPNARLNDFESLSYPIAASYQEALRNWVSGNRQYPNPPGSFSDGLNFLNEWITVFNQQNPNMYLEPILGGFPGVQVRDRRAGCIN